MSLHYHFVEQYSDSMLDALVRHYEPRRSDVLYISVGVHYHDDLPAFETSMASLLHWMRLVVHRMHYIALHDIALHYIALHDIALHCIA